MELSKEANNTLLNNIAFANYVREEIIADFDKVPELMTKLIKVKSATNNQSLKELIADVEELFKTKKSDNNFLQDT